MTELRTPRFAQRAAYAGAAGGVLAFWCGMLIAARSYPSEYDWRYMTISSLVYAERNPNGHWWASGGLALCGLAGLCWTAVLVRQGRQAPGRVGIWVLGLGYLCMMWCALLPERLLRIPKSHDALALAAFVGICVGMVHATLRAATLRGVQRGESSGSARLAPVIFAGAALAPIVLAALAQAYVSYELPELKWVNLAWRARGVPLYLSFAFWEWVTCAVFSVYMVALARNTLAECRSS